MTRPAHILIIDDEPELLTLAGQRLKSWGYEVLQATSAEDGLRLADECSPDLILLDVLMPKMKGREACAALKANDRTKHIPVIFLSSLGMPDHIKGGLDAGAEDYILKPFNADDLRDRIRVCLLRHGFVFPQSPGPA